jgi:hypothetical protein
MVSTITLVSRVRISVQDERGLVVAAQRLGSGHGRGTGWGLASCQANTQNA